MSPPRRGRAPHVAPGDTFYRLVRDAQGQLVRSGGSGQVDYIDTSAENGRPSIQADFTRNGGTIISHPILSAKPTYLIINNNGVEEYRYVAAEE